VIDTLFRALFKYPLLVFEQGRFAFGASRSMWLTVAIIAGAALYALWTYRQVAALAGRDRIVCWRRAWRSSSWSSSACCGRCSCSKVAVPQQNFVAVILDDSSSMQVTDYDGQPRSTFVTNELGRPDAPLLTALGKRSTSAFSGSRPPPNGCNRPVS
jgi:hypothetical protein